MAMAFTRCFPAKKSTQFLKKVFSVSVIVGSLPLVGYFLLLDPAKTPVDKLSAVNTLSELSPLIADGKATNLSLSWTSIKNGASDSKEEQKNTVITSVEGQLQVHTWWELCGTGVDVLRRYPHFPFFPDTRAFISSFQLPVSDKKSYGQRIFGYISPKRTCKYEFAISSDDTSELWISRNEDPKNSHLIAKVFSPSSSAWTEEENIKKYPDQLSREISLQAGQKYFIEAILKQGEGIAHLSVFWSCPELNPSFEIVSSQYLSTFYETKHDLYQYGNPENIPFHAGKPAKNYSQARSDKSENLLRYFNLPLVDRMEYLNASLTCRYDPSFLIRKKLKKFSGVWNVKVSKVFPKDDTDMYSGIRGWSNPNSVADEKVIQGVVDKIMSLFKSRKYVLKRIHKVIQKSDPKKGDRFSVDLELEERSSSQLYRWSDHVFLKSNSNILCFPEGIDWNSNVTVYFILPVKNQGKWVVHFINELTKLSLLTGDTNFHVIVIDFESQDIDVNKAFNTSALSTRYTLLNMKGKFYKTLALNKGVEVVPSPHDIIFLFDLHIDVPADILDSLRKNTIEGRITFFPAVGRLNCGSNSKEHRGFWQTDGYGLAGFYKSDWIRFGGMNIKDFNYYWGGEDWDLVDRVLSNQLEIERVKYPGLHHYFHGKQNLWQKN